MIQWSECIKRMITASILGSIFWLVYFYLPPIYFSGVLAIILGCILFLEFPLLLKNRSWSYWSIMILYPITPFAFLMYMNHHPLYHDLLYYLFTLVFSFETMSYFVGTFFGKHLIIPSVSPKKTIEGVLGGTIAVFFSLEGLLWWDNVIISWPKKCIFVFLLVTIAFIGDAWESWLKRQAGVKDSGSLLPGHGGFLDRFDGVMMCTYIVFLCRDYLSSFLHIS